MSCTSALTRKPKGQGRRNFAQGYPRSHATPTVKSQGHGAGAYCGGHLAAQLVIITMKSYTFLPLRKSTAHISMQFTGDKHYREQIKMSAFWAKLEQDQGSKYKKI